VVSESIWQHETSSDEPLSEIGPFRIQRERYRSQLSDKTREHEVLEAPDSVVAVALTRGRQVILVRRFRPGSRADSLELPSRLLAAGENPTLAAIEELRDTFGFVGHPPVMLGSHWSDPALMRSRVTTVVVLNVTRVRDPTFDESEEMLIRTVPADEIPGMIRGGEINNALTVGALLLWLVSELPGPMHPADLKTPRRSGTATLVASVAAVAGLLHLVLSMRDILLTWFQAVWGAASVAAAITLWALVPPPRVALVKAARVVDRRFFFMLFVTPALIVGWFIVLGGLAGWLLGLMEALGWSWL
jgi:hypothetical protein